PPMFFYNIKLELSLIGFSFPTNLAKPVPLAVVLLNNNKVFSYFKKVIVIPTIYLRLVKSLRFNI
ncbi:uncharacterized protein K460DRAFT_297959, partial [Cucurbitaria berberidis CBS 394.84]